MKGIAGLAALAVVAVGATHAADAAAAVREVPIAFAAANGDTLRGTLTVPDGRGPHPGVVMVGGFGPNGRDGTIGRSQYREWAGRLGRRGVAVLRYDRRGIGDSEGSNLAWLDTRALTADAERAARAMGRHPAVDSRRVSFVGHSQGGILALGAAASGAPVRAIVTLGSPGRPLGQIGWVGGRERVLLSLVVGRDAADRLLQANPLATARRVRQPVLVMHGTADGVVVPADARRIDLARRGADRPTRRLMLRGLSHYMQNARGETPTGVVRQIARVARTGTVNPRR